MGWTDLVATGIDVAGNLALNQRQYNQQKRLMEIQQQNQQELNLQGQQLQMKTWEETNYPAQMKMLESAGLNPSLMYGKGGAGGTTGSQGGGSAAGGNAPQAPHMDITSKLAMLANMKQMKAQTELLESQKGKTDAEKGVIEKYGGVQAETGVRLQEAETKLKGQELINQQTINRINQIEETYNAEKRMWEIKNMAHDAQLKFYRNEITKETLQAEINLIRQNAVGAEIRNELSKADINLKETEINAIKAGITQKAIELMQKGEQINIDRFEAEMRAEYPALGQTTGAIVKKVFKAFEYLGTYLTGDEPIKDRVK